MFAFQVTILNKEDAQDSVFGSFGRLEEIINCFQDSKTKRYLSIWGQK